jgi:hypothetical protein
MFDLIIRCLDVDGIDGESVNIDKAKGMYKIQTTFKSSWKQYKQKKRWLKKY